MSNWDDEPLFIAEISANHLGSLNRAKELIFAASESGATSVKFQTYTADTMTLNTDKFKVSEGHELWGGRTLYSLYQEAFTPWEWHEELFELSRSLGLIPFSSPFDFTAVEFLEGLGAPMYKIASLETSDHALIRKCAETGKPLIVSTGATMWDEITDLVGVVRETGNQDLTLLVCTSSYPARAEDANLNRIHTLREHFGVKVGISDHTLGSGVATAAIALGAVAIEKHLTLKRSDGGADSAFSMEPNEFLAMVEAGKQAAKSLGKRDWEIQPAEFESRRLRRSLYIVKDVKKGEKVTSENIRAIRPGAGASAALFADFLGKTFADDFSLGTPLEINSVNP